MLDARHVLFAGDWHANVNYAQRLISRLGPQADVVMHLGDFGYDFRPSYIDEITRAAGRADTVVLFIRGNHDNPDFLHELPVGTDGLAWLSERVAWIPDGHRWTWSGVSFLAMGGAVSIDRSLRVPGVSWWPGETVPHSIMQAAADTGPVDILLAHDVPRGVEIPGFDEFGSTWPITDVYASAAYRDDLGELAQAVRPRFLWHGHHHLRYMTLAEFGDSVCMVTGLAADGDQFTSNTDLIDLTYLSQPSWVQDAR